MTDIEKRIDTMLIDIGVPSHLKGYEALSIAIRLMYEDPAKYSQITKELYPEVAKQMGGANTATRIERAIRHAIEYTWSNSDDKALIKYFGNSVSAFKAKPINSQFIMRMCKVLRS